MHKLVRRGNIIGTPAIVSVLIYLRVINSRSPNDDELRSSSIKTSCVKRRTVVKSSEG